MEGWRETAVHEVEETAAQAEVRRLRAVFDHIPIGLLLVDVEGRPVRANVEALRILGADSVEALPGRRTLEAYHLDGRRVGPDEWPVVRTIATGAPVQAALLEVVTRMGRAILEISSAPILEAEGELTGALSVFRDVTGREEAERIERDFVTNAAHQLQSPIAAIISAVEVLRSGAEDGPERDVFLGHIQRASDRLAGLARGLLVLARVQAGVEAPREELFALQPLLGRLAGDLEPAPGVEVQVVCPPEAALVTNPVLLEQALVNVAENAAKHTDAGSITLAVSVVAGATEIAVTDTGPGIAAIERPRVFDRFYRGEGQAAGGFGLGLAIARASVESLGAQLELDSAPGEGTTVRLRFQHTASLVSA